MPVHIPAVAAAAPWFLAVAAATAFLLLTALPVSLPSLRPMSLPPPQLCYILGAVIGGPCPVNHISSSFPMTITMTVTITIATVVSPLLPPVLLALPFM